jgi:uncharacterized protein DUF6444
VSDLRAVNARLRQLLADKDELIASQDTLLGMQRDQLTGKDELIAEQAKLIALVEEQNAELRRLGLDSTNSSTPPSTDSIAAKAKRHKANSERKRSANRQPGGQKGHPGSGLELAV